VAGFPVTAAGAPDPAFTVRFPTTMWASVFPVFLSRTVTDHFSPGSITESPLPQSSTRVDVGLRPESNWTTVMHGVMVTVLGDDVPEQPLAPV